LSYPRFSVISSWLADIMWSRVVKYGHLMQNRNWICMSDREFEILNGLLSSLYVTRGSFSVEMSFGRELQCSICVYILSYIIWCSVASSQTWTECNFHLSLSLSCVATRQKFKFIFQCRESHLNTRNPPSKNLVFCSWKMKNSRVWLPAELHSRRAQCV